MPYTHNFENHPCFNRESSHTYARIHLPVAPRCNVQCRFCNRKYSCVNESRPGVTAQVMTPAEALEHLKRSMARVPNISVVGIAGPGDPFANPEETLETFRLVKEAFPDLMLCVSTNGLGVMRHVGALQRLGVAHVTVTVNAVDLDVGAQVYDWVKWGDRVFRGREAAHLLWDNQEMAIQALDFRDIVVKVNTVCIPGVNEDHVEAISETVSRLGASLHNVIPLIPTAGTPFADVVEPSAATMKAVRARAEAHLPQMEHCSRCRADAVGLLGQSNPVVPSSLDQPGVRPYVAVCTTDGVTVDRHLGQSEVLWIYEPSAAGPRLVDVRKAPPSHTGASRWVRLAELLSDCSLLVSAGIGPVPRAVLSANGIGLKVVGGPLAEAWSPLETGPFLGSWLAP
jgi:nitrogen fixation protein NifB